MKIAPFGVEQWMNKYEAGAVTNLAETCVKSMTFDELLDITGEREDITKSLKTLTLSYGDIEGSDELRTVIASLYRMKTKENVMITNGGSSANFLTSFTLVEPGDEVICLTPTYQQLYSIPEAFLANVKLLKLAPENDFLPDIAELKKTVTKNTKLICINNPNNPTGAVMGEELLKEIADIAQSAGAWIHCDEVYRFLAHDGGDVPSMADIYDKAVVTGSMSKCFSLAGLRIGWVTGRVDFIGELFSRRDYTTISCSRINDLLARKALKHKDAILARNLDIVRGCAKILDDWIAQEEFLSYVKPHAGTTAFVKFHAPLSSEAFCLGLYEHDGTFILPGSCFGKDWDDMFRMGYAYSPQALSLGLRKISDYIKTLKY